MARKGWSHLPGTGDKVRFGTCIKNFETLKWKAFLHDWIFMLFYTLATVHELNPHLFAKHNIHFLQVSNNRFFLSDTMMAWPRPAFVLACAICLFQTYEIIILCQIQWWPRSSATNINFTPVLGIPDILVRIRIPGSVPLTMDPDPDLDSTPDPTPFFSDCKGCKKNNFFMFFCDNLPTGHYLQS
jgi:hypothetical protein